MIRLESDKGNLDLSPETEIPWRIINPFFEESEDFSPQLSLPFTLPMTANNQRILSYAEQLQVSVYAKTIQVTVYVQGVLFFRGALNILRPGSNGYSVNITYDRKSINTDKSIRAFSFGGARASSSLAAARTAANNLDYPFTDYVFPEVKNNEEKKNVEYGGSQLTINDYHGATMAYSDTELVTPMPFINYVIKQLLSELGGIKADGSLFSQIEDLIIENPVVTNTMVGEKLKLTTIYDPARHQFDNSFKELEFRIDASGLNYNVNTGAIISFELFEYPATAMFPVIPHTITYTVQAMDIGNPSQLLQNIWNAILTASGAFMLRDQNWAHPTSPWFIMAHASRFDFTNDTRNAKAYEVAVQYQKSGTHLYNDIQVGKHLPNMKVKEFINAIKNGLNLTLFYNMATNTITFTPRKEQLTTHKYKDYSHKLVAGYEKEIVETSNYRFVFQNDKTDQETADESTWYATNHSEYNALGYKEFNIAMACPKVDITAGWATVKKPLIKYSDTEDPEFTLRLLKWKGMTTVMGITYPKANNDGLTPNEMYDTWFREWYRATKLGREIADMNLALTLDDILYFNPELKWKVLHNMYIWKEIEMPIRMDGIGISRVRLMRIPANANIFNTPDGEALPPE